MLYIPNIDNYFKILTDEEVKDFVAINFSEYFKSTKEKLYHKLNEKQNLRKVSESLYLFLTTSDVVEKYFEIIQTNSSDNCIHCYNVEILNIFDPELQLINTKPMIKNKLKELLSDLKKFNVQTILVLDYKKRRDCKIFHSSARLLSNDADIDCSIITKIKNCGCKDWFVLDVIIKHSIKICEC